MKLRIRQTAGVTLAGLTLVLALVGFDSLMTANETLGKALGLVIVTCLLIATQTTGKGRHQK